MTPRTNYHLVRCCISSQLIFDVIFILLQPKVLGVSACIIFLIKQKTILWKSVHLDYRKLYSVSSVVIVYTSSSRIWFTEILHLLSSYYALGIKLNASYALSHKGMGSAILSLLQIKTQSYRKVKELSESHLASGRC